MKRKLIGALLSVSVLSIAACSGSSTTPTIPQRSNTGTLTIGSSGGSTTFSSAGNVSAATLSFGAPSAGAGSTLTFVAGPTAPSGTPALSTGRKSESSETAIGPSNIGIWYVTLSFSADTTFPSTPALAIQLASVDSTVGYYLAFFDPTSGSGWVEPAEGPGAVSGNLVTFAATSHAQTFKAGVIYVIALYASNSNGQRTPTPGPTPTPTVAPLTASTSSLALTQTGPASFTVTEAGYRGQYTVTSSNTSVATASSPLASTADTTTIDLTAVAAGTTNVVVQDSNSQSITVAVGVTLTPVTIQSKGGHK